MPLEDSQPSEGRQQEQERAQRISYVEDVVRTQAKKGDPNPPPDMEVEVPTEEWRKLYEKEVRWRRLRARDVMGEVLIGHLEEAIVPEREGFRPEEAGAALLFIKPQDRVLTILRDSITWLQRTLEEAEREQGQY